MHPIAVRILEGESICDHEIWEFNAQTIIDHERNKRPHDPKGCKINHCTHGQGTDMPYAVELAERAVRDCTCGRY